MQKDSDWYPATLDGERTMYENINSKIDDYAGKYTFLTPAYLTQIHAMCGAFIEGFDKLSENRATAQQLTTWFSNVVGSKQKNQPIPAPPVFQAISMPAGATIGLEQQCREFARLLKAQSNYDEADGVDLMVEKGETAETDLENVAPELKISSDSGNAVMVEWKKTGFDALELQWRKGGTTMWQPADKSTEKIIDFAPPMTESGVPEKFEFRAVYLIKNKRVGQWSPIYTETVG